LLAVEDPAPLPEPLQPLSFAGPEVAAAAARYPEATVLRHEQASAERVRSGLKATHSHTHSLLICAAIAVAAADLGDRGHVDDMVEPPVPAPR
jgi:hypothetical protein